jgi:RHS repeat-associated protein
MQSSAISTSTISSSLNTDVNNFLTTNQNNSYSSNQPKAFLNWIIVDEEFNAVSSPGHVGAVQVPSITGAMQKQALVGPANMVVRRNGWLYVYLSNESNQNVYFDNLAIQQKRGPLVEQKDYYAFDMEIPGLSTQAMKPKYDQNRHTYNSIEHDTTFGLDNYEAHFRNLDPETGRWWQIDPKPDYAQSLYSAMGNNPILHNDPFGDTLKTNGGYWANVIAAVAISKLEKSKTAKASLDQLRKSKNTFTINLTKGKNGFTPNKKAVLAEIFN